jgi:Na+/H+-dicarboxylate symporter
MCATTATKKTRILLNPLVLYMLMITLGILSGLSGVSYLQSFGALISDIFIKIFKFISLPLIALSIIVTLSSHGADQNMSKIWKKTILYTISTTIIAATISCILYFLISPSNVVNNITDNANFGDASNKTSYLQHLLSLVPSTIFSPFIEHQVIGVLIIGALFGIAIRFIPDTDARYSVTKFFQGLHSIFIVITKWIVTILPIGLYGFITTMVVELRGGLNIGGIGEYLAVVVLANLVQGLVILPLWLRYNGINPFATAKAMSPALSLAFLSKSSAGTLPVTINLAETKLNINPKISRFVLPLCTTMNMNGCAAFIFATVIYLMQNNGIEISFLTMICWIAIATIAAIGNAGVPMGCFFLSISLLSSMNVPITLMGIILPFYAIIDMLETSLNVWSDSCVATVVNKKIPLTN